MESSTRTSAAHGLLASAIRACIIASLACGALGFGAGAGAAEGEDAPAAENAGLSAAELDEVVGPIALYPDELLAIVLPASTYPLQVVQAARLLEKRKSDPDLKPDDDWDASVIGLMNYPEVIDLMNEDLDWTWKLGEAVSAQQGDVMNAVQRFRARVDEAGNLESNEKVTVVKETEQEKQIIVIESASPEVIYVPTYQPTTVVVYQTAPYPYYYSSPYPYYYRPAAAFWTGMFVGSAVGYGMRWGYRGGDIDIDRNVNVNVDRPTRPSTPDRPGRPGGGAGRPEKWKADRGGPGKQAGARPGGARGPSAGTRPSAGSGKRPATGARTRPSAGGGAGPATRPSAGRQTGPRTSQGTRAGAATGGQRRSSGRDLTRASQRSSRGSSMGSYSSGSRSRSNASRGASSRGRSRGGRSGGGRSGGGRR